MIEEWAAARGHQMNATRLYHHDALPLPAEVRMLVIMGGPMNALDDARHPWLALERAFIADVIRAGRPVLGVCLGAQLISAALGGTISPAPQREIGWWPVFRAAEAAIPWPEEVEVFHWHGDTFTLPDGAEHLCRSAACPQQGYILRGRVIGLQFHLEMRPADIAALSQHCGSEIVDGPWIQTAAQLSRPNPERQERLRRLLDMMLDALASQAPSTLG